MASDDDTLLQLAEEILTCIYEFCDQHNSSMLPNLPLQMLNPTILLLESLQVLFHSYFWVTWFMCNVTQAGLPQELTKLAYSIPH